MESTSKAWRLNGADFAKSFVGLAVVLLGAGATWLEQNVASMDFGEWQLIAVALNSFVVNLIRKWVTDHTKEGT